MTLTLMAPPGAAVFRITALAVPATARIVGGVPGIAWPASWVWLGGTAVLLIRLAIGYRRFVPIVAMMRGRKRDAACAA